jgi:FG-GAP-like repeat/FG-GAP repeat
VLLFNRDLQTRSVALGDLNGDGSLDLVTANAFSDDVSILIGNGDGGFQSPQYITLGGVRPRVISVSDVNGDGLFDLVVATESGTVSVLHGNGDGTFQPQQRFMAAVFSPSSLFVTDVDGDGKLDIVATDEFFDEISVLMRQ